MTLGGELLDQGTIEFAPQGAAGVGSGAVIRNGVYEIPTRNGLPPGTYLVRIYSSDKEATEPQEPSPPGPTNAPPAKQRIPAAYNTQSDRTVEVTADGPNRFDFDIPRE